MPTLATQQNYKMACALGMIEDAMRILMAADVAVHDITINDGQPVMITEPLPKIKQVMPLSTRREIDTTTVRVVLCGCVVEYTKPTSDEVAA